jgi:tryptophan-rich sensory protein
MTVASAQRPAGRLGTDLLGLAVSLLICAAVATVGSLLTVPYLADWYAGIQKPSWTPPNAVFGPVWSTLFAMMAVSAWLIWRRRREVSVRKPLMVFAIQLALNAAWSGLFFAAHRPDLAFVDVVLLWLAIAATITAFWTVGRLAALLLVPYLLWVSYAAALNLAIWRMNA